MRLLTQLTSTFGTLTVASHGAFQLIMAIAAVACLVALAIATFLPGREAVEAAKAAKDSVGAVVGS
jgi:VanZ family protein